VLKPLDFILCTLCREDDLSLSLSPRCREGETRMRKEVEEAEGKKVPLGIF